MTASRTIIRLAKTLALAATLGALLVPAAQAGNRIVDDYFRDPIRTTAPADRIVDDWFRAPQNTSPVATAPVGNRIVDDYFRDPPAVTPTQVNPGGFAWGDFAIGAAAMLGLVLIAAGLGLGALALRQRSGQLRTS